MNTLKVPLDKIKTLNIQLLWYEREWKAELVNLVEDMFQYTVYCYVWKNAVLNIYILLKAEDSKKNYKQHLKFLELRKKKGKRKEKG